MPGVKAVHRVPLAAGLAWGGGGAPVVQHLGDLCGRGIGHVRRTGAASSHVDVLQAGHQPNEHEAQIQGGALMSLSMCLPDVAIPWRSGVVERSNFGDLSAPRITDLLGVAVRMVPSANAQTGTGEHGVPPLAPSVANPLARLTDRPRRELSVKLV